MSVLTLTAAIYLILPVQGEQLRWISAAEQALESSGAPALSVAVGTEKFGIRSFAVGKSDLRSGTKARIADQFGIGSISKTLTAALILRLVDEGKLALDDAVEKHVETFPYRGKGVTIRRILTHQSGIPDSFNTTHWITTRHFETTADALIAMGSGTLLFQPGSKAQYATGPYTWLAAVIENATDLTFEEAMRQYVTAPLKMVSTIPNDPAQERPRRVVFYLRDNAGKIDPVLADPSFKLAGAGYLSTAEDLVKFGQALLQPGFLSESSLKEMFGNAQTNNGSATEFGLGCRVGPDPAMALSWQTELMIHQPGGGPGISSWLVINGEKKAVVAILSNLTGAPVGGKLMSTILSSLEPASRHRYGMVLTGSG